MGEAKVLSTAKTKLFFLAIADIASISHNFNNGLEGVSAHISLVEEFMVCFISSKSVKSIKSKVKIPLKSIFN